MQQTAPDSLESRSTLRWSAIFAGVFVTLGTMALLYALGLGAGFSAIDIDTHGRLHNVGIFAGIYGAVVPLVAMLAGGFAAARAARAGTVGVGMFHGWVLWGVSAVCLVWLTGHIVAAALGGVADAAEGVASGASQVVSGAAKAVGASGEGLQKLGEKASEAAKGHMDLQFDDVLAQINKRRAKGASPVTEAQLKQFAQALGRRAIDKDGDISEQDVSSLLVSKTGITQEEANEVSADVQRRIAQAHEELNEQKEAAEKKLAELKQQAEKRAKQVANDAAEQLAHVSWGLFAALAASLVAAVAGGAIAAKTIHEA